MLRLIPEVRRGRPLRLLCIGAHSDDLEIGCGGTILTWLASMPAVEVTWGVLRAEGARASEARPSASVLPARGAAPKVFIADFLRLFLRTQYARLEGYFE